jgi:hypothetical protein
MKRTLFTIIVLVIGFISLMYGIIPVYLRSIPVSLMSYIK